MYGKRVLFWRFRSNLRWYSNGSTKKLLEFLADMPKAHSPRITEVQRQRQQIAKKAEKYGASNVYLQVLGSGARGAPNTLYLFSDQRRYLFNCGESTQRLAHEHKVKLSRLKHIFITSKTWKNIGGLPGLSLTLQDVGVPSITLHGPAGLDELYNATKRFVIMKDMAVTMAPCSPAQDFEDSVMTVKYVLLHPSTELFKDIKPAAKRQKTSNEVANEKAYEAFMHDDTDYYKRNKSGEKKFVKERSPVKSQSSKPSPNSPEKKSQKVLNELIKKNETPSAVSYICTLKKRLGTLDLAKCVEKGVKPGPLLGQLKNGHDVVLEDGTIVMSRDVKTPDDPGPVFIVLDVPDIDYLREQDFASHFADGNNPVENIPTLIVHYTLPHVFHSKPYQEFIAKFGTTVKHLLLNGQNSCLGSEAVHRTQHKLHLLDPDIFPLLKDFSVPALWNAQPPLAKGDSPIRLKGLEELKKKIALAQFQNILNMDSSCKEAQKSEDGKKTAPLELIAGHTLTTFHLRPKKQLDRSTEPKLHIQDYIQETMDVDGFVGSLESFRKMVDRMRYDKRFTAKEYPKVVFLGTGSCIPSKTRNTSAIVIQVDENRSILLDCGEGTFCQLVRFYGPKRVNSFLRTLRAIYVSHLHADHHIGLIGVLQARRQAYDEISAEDHPDPVLLLAPGQIMSWLTMYDQQFERIRTEFTLVPNQSLLVNPPKEQVTSTENIGPVLSSIGVNQIQTCFVPHCPNAFGVSIDIGEHKITYSGDTLPCQALVNLGQNSTLLIHEATMEDELAEEARTKMHSTTTQAIDIGIQMNAKYTVLTHFSQRYARLPRLSANILNDNTSVGIAFDNMQITMSDLDLLPFMYAPLQLMFAEHCIEMELKAAHRARQKERRTSRQSSPNDIRGNSHIFQPQYKDSNSSRLRANAWSGSSSLSHQSSQKRKKTKEDKKLSNQSPRSIKSDNSERSTPQNSNPSGSVHTKSLPDSAPTPSPSSLDTKSDFGADFFTEIGKNMNSLTKPETKQTNENKKLKQNTVCPTVASSPPLSGHKKPTMLMQKRMLSSSNEQTNQRSTPAIHKTAISRLPIRAHSPKRASSSLSSRSPNRRMHSPKSVRSPKEAVHSPTFAPPIGTLNNNNMANGEILKSKLDNVCFGDGKAVSRFADPTDCNESSSLFNKININETGVHNVSGSCFGSTKSFKSAVKTTSSLRSLKGSSLPESRPNDSSKTQPNTQRPNSLASSRASSRDSSGSRFQSANVNSKEKHIRGTNYTHHADPSKENMNTAARTLNAQPPDSNSFTKAKQRRHRSPTIKPRETIKSRDMYLRTRELIKQRAVVSVRSRQPNTSRSKESFASQSRTSFRSTSSELNQERARKKVTEFDSLTRPVSAAYPKVHPVISHDFESATKPVSAADLKIHPVTCNVLPESLVFDTFKNKYPETNPIFKKAKPIPFSVIHSKNSFRPQLEDIKSSFLILNCKTNESGQNGDQPNSTSSVNKPKPFDEGERLKMLENARKMFKSKQYLETQRYEKIDGLNWIPWK